MADLIREAAEHVATALFAPKHLGRPIDQNAMVAQIDAALRETFTGAGLEEVLPNNYCEEDDAPSRTNPAFYRPAIAALIEARVAAARREAFEEAAMLVRGWHYRKGGYTELAHTISALASSEPGSDGEVER